MTANANATTARILIVVATDGSGSRKLNARSSSPAATATG